MAHRFTGKLSKLGKAVEATVVPTTGDDGTPGTTTAQHERLAVLRPCQTPEELKAWMVKYLNLDFPDQQVDPDSTGSPFDHMWRIYQAGVNNDDDFYRRVLLYAARASYKTLGVSVLELLAMLHMDRNVVHLAAIEQQAGKAQEYLRAFLSREGLDEFAVGNNKRSVAVVWAVHRETGEVITLHEYRHLDRSLRRNYVYHVHYTKVIVNTPQSSNSDHVAFFVVDEVDLIRYPIAYDEAKLIPETQKSVDGKEQPPITVLTSSRKYAGGLVQREIDQAETTGTAVWHWNILDVSRRCPDDRHRPDLPKEARHIRDSGMSVLDQTEFDALQASNPKEAADYVRHELHGGCVINCPMRVQAGCKGRLAGVTSQAAMLKSIKDVVAKFVEVSVEMAEAQVMCWKPGNEGSVYRHFNRKRHMLTVAEMWESVTGEVSPPNVTKALLVEMLKARRVKWAVGMDFGYTHNFAVSLWAIDGQRAFLIDAFEVSQLELNQKIELCDVRIKPFGPVVWPDPAYPSDIASFRKKGYVMKTHTKDVLGGINIVRNKLNPPHGNLPELFMLKGDPAGELVARRFEAYKWKTDAQGRPLDEPDDYEDDTMDDVRYVISNEFRQAGKVSSPNTPPPPPVPVNLTTQNWMQAKLQELTGAPSAQVAATPTKIKRGGFFADFG